MNSLKMSSVTWPKKSKSSSLNWQLKQLPMRKITYNSLTNLQSNNSRSCKWMSWLSPIKTVLTVISINYKTVSTKASKLMPMMILKMMTNMLKTLSNLVKLRQEMIKWMRRINWFRLWQTQSLSSKTQTGTSTQDSATISLTIMASSRIYSRVSKHRQTQIQMKWKSIWMTHHHLSTWMPKCKLTPQTKLIITSKLTY